VQHSLKLFTYRCTFFYHTDRCKVIDAQTGRVLAHPVGAGQRYWVSWLHRVIVTLAGASQAVIVVTF